MICFFVSVSVAPETAGIVLVATNEAVDAVSNALLADEVLDDIDGLDMVPCVVNAVAAGVVLEATGVAAVAVCELVVTDGVLAV